MIAIYKRHSEKVSIKKITAMEVGQLYSEVREFYNRANVNLSYMHTCSALAELIKTLSKKFNEMQWNPKESKTLTISRTQALALCVAAEDMDVNSLSFKISMLIKQQLLGQHYDILRKS